ncbi:phosphatase PAP2 family protein [Bosea sp. (in: a-proteobacteria)]|uniref:phosphatase PAP2 family protein n=1 Tax=Bosea sp. (in: a-proteobacteria) TaxID=1871050 RepID=UPI002737284B|nr:phosphatase PAP2 family protein [Bosea sp. (in: a-proteobacteria)]MDP3256238.1 hypothetical protein [Bosea sp. (in: a-proteobacteria)]
MARDAAFGPADGADGADGAEGFENFDALGGGGRSAFRPIGVAPEMAIRQNPVEPDYRGHRWPPRLGHAWPPTSPTDCWPIAPEAILPRLTDFTPDNASLLVLAEFVQLKNSAGRLAWAELMQPNDMTDDIDSIFDLDGDSCSNVQRELKHLRRLAQFRSGAMSEAMAQRNGIIGYFRALLQFNVQTHPYTYYLVATALRLGQFLCMYYKGVYNRPRPVRLDPSLLAPIDPPGHPAYPSGHATQAFLIARCLEQVAPVALGTGPANRQSPFWLLAERIAKLREVLGVHYPSDTKGGLRLAEAAFPLMLRCLRIAGGVDNDGDGVPDNHLSDAFGEPLSIAGQPIYDDGWLALARREWEPRQ